MPDTLSYSSETRLDGFTVAVHLGMMLFGILAWISGDGAGDYKHLHHSGFALHRWLGMATAACVGLRLLYGLWGPEPVRFSAWLPYTGTRWRLIMEDIGGLASLRLPQRPPRQGLASLVEAFGLLVFSWMAATGALIFGYLVPGRKAGGFLHLIKELHEVGEALIPIFLAIHVGAVVLHALAGDHRWRRIFFLRQA